ncbi:hypothetical protein L1887_07571 [Cichorium endivia]|nr:hypothetical protein L1887_07571 [Cichorium endivia]
MPDIHNVVADTIAMKSGKDDVKKYKKGNESHVARVLWFLCVGNLAICRDVTESRALLCFSVLVEKGDDEVQYNSLMALVEIHRRQLCHGTPWSKRIVG